MVVDDHEANVALLNALLADWGYRNVIGFTDSSEALTACKRDPPDLLLLDLYMPNPDGFAVLKALGDQIHAAVSLPVLVLTGSGGPVSKHHALEAGARDFLTKPLDADEVRLRVHNALELRSLQLVQRDYAFELERRVLRRTSEAEAARAEAEAARFEVVERLARAGEFRDDATGEHIHRVGRTAALLAKRAGADPEYVRDVWLAAPLHDIGKLAVPDRILLKPGRLTDEEFKQIERHAEIGAQLLDGGSSKLLGLAREIALSHHERWDGRGYPYGLTEDEIPLAGRLVALADVFDALTHERPYKPAWSVADSVTEMAAQAGTQFDPQLLDAFLELDHQSLV